MPRSIENLEIDLLLEAIFRRYGYDFRGYARASVARRIDHFLAKYGYDSPSALIPHILHDERIITQLVAELSVPVTEMFRDPEVYRSIRRNAVALLKTHPFIKVWHAGCATGEEAYSLAILLREEGLYERVTLYATDFNDRALHSAKEGVYPLSSAERFMSSHRESGGTGSLADYYQADQDSMAIRQALKKNITFANHNLATDGVFGEMHLVLCRNVLIYFTRELQDRVLNLFLESLVHGGFLCLGKRESLRFSTVREQFRAIDEANRIYQKTGF